MTETLSTVALSQKYFKVSKDLLIFTIEMLHDNIGLYEPIPLIPKYGNLLLCEKGASTYGWTF